MMRRIVTQEGLWNFTFRVVREKLTPEKQKSLEQMSSVEGVDIKFPLRYFRLELCDTLLELKLFENITLLDIAGNNRVTHVNYLKNLKTLYIDDCTSLLPTAIEGLTLRILSMINVTQVKNISEMTTLECLDISGKCMITENQLCKMNLHTLAIQNNKTIKNIPPMTSLKVLYIGGGSVLREESLQRLKLEKLYMSYNEKIRYLPGQTAIYHLRADHTCLEQGAMQNLPLEFLSFSGDKNIHDVSHLKGTLKRLLLHRNQTITQQNIAELDLLELDISCNHLITDISPFTNLQQLDISCIRVNHSKFTKIKKKWFFSIKKIDLYKMYAKEKFSFIEKCNIGQENLSNLNLICLYAAYNSKITTISHMRNLVYLVASGTCQISQAELLPLSLKILDASNNPRIIDVSWMTSLKKLYASGSCGITQEGIKDLDLEYLDCSDNPRITDVSYMKNLTILHANYHSGIRQKGINNSNLIKLKISNNQKITYISKFTFLKYLDISYDCDLRLDGIEKMFLTVLKASHNSGLKNISSLFYLKYADLSGECGVDQKGLGNLDLIRLNISDNPKIHNLAFMKSLTYLDISGNENVKYNLTGLNLHHLIANYTTILKIPYMSNLKFLEISHSLIGQKVIKKFDLYYLNAADNPYITDLSHMKSLKILDISGNSQISRDNIKNLTLQKLKTDGNKNFKNDSVKRLPDIYEF
jgi:hypothetical protein